MHRCLTIPEMLAAIIDALSKNSGRSRDISKWAKILPTPDPTDALAIALTCKTFLEPGLNALWCIMYSSDPLLTLSVPADGLHLHVGQEDGDTTSHSRMDRFIFYAHRVRVLYSWDNEGVPVAWRKLSIGIWRQSQPMLPNLRYLFWGHVNPATFPYISLLASPLLQSVILFPRKSDGVHDDTVFSSLSTLARFSPMLSELKLKDNGIDPDDQSYARTILHLSALQFMTSVYLITPTSYEVIRQLSKMPYLRSLILQLFGRGYERPDAFTRLNFASLQELVLKRGNLDVITRILESFSDQLGIQTISATIETLGYESAATIRGLIKAVCRICSPETLTSITLSTIQSADGHLRPSYWATHDTLFPLFVFHRMESFSLSVFKPDTDWDDRLLESIGSCWPHLRLLVLFGRRPSGFKIQAFASLAKGCPRLEYLGLPLAPWNADVGWTPLHSSESIPHSPLRMVLRYPLPDLEAEAESYLRLLFPNLSQLDVVKV